MIYSGNIQKMRSIFENPVKYFLQCGDSEIELNNLIGKKIKIEYQNRINCISCGALTKTSFAVIAILALQVFLNVMKAF